jgi:hypothetical protein
MLTDDRTRDLLRSAVADLTVRDAPADELLRRGRKVRRRTRVIAGVGVAAAVGLVVVGSVVLFDTTNRADQPATTATTATTAPSETPPPSTQNGLVTPPGTRLVGMGPIAVAVPQSWGTNDVRCGTPLSDTVVFESTGTRSCFVEQRDVSSVHFGRIGMWERRTWERNATTAMDLGEIDITRSEIGPYREGLGEPTYPFSVGVVTVPGYDVAMWVVSTDEELIRSVLDSVREIPNGYVAVPVRSAASRTWPFEADAGLDVRQVAVYREGVSPGVLLSSDPPLGSIVPRGSRVRLTVSGPGEPLSGPDAPLARKLHAFAAAPGAETLRAIPLSDQVAIGLGGDVVQTLTAEQLQDPSAWVIHRPYFAGYVGPFNPLEQLRRDPEFWSITEGKQLGCPWARTAALPGYEQDRRLTIEPSDITSCLEWFGVDVYVDESGSVDAISLNLVEP